MLRNRVTLVAILLALVGACALNSALPHRVAADDRPSKKPKEPELLPLEAFMRAKLASSEQVLDGLVTEDFGKIEQATLRLQFMTKAEEWKASDSPQFLELSAEFRKILSRLKVQAEKKNLEGAALTYLEMTMSCVRCHQELRHPMKAEKEEQ